MTRAAARKRKEGLRERFNQFLDEVFTAGPSFSMDTIRRYESAAIQAREREMMRESTPRRSDSEIGELVFRRVEATGMDEINRQMTDQALEAAINLGERLELSATGGRRLDIRGWVRS
jgi:hypothetical protein